MTPDEVLARVARVLRDVVGPEVGDDFARTQAYMAAVVLEKVAGQIRSTAERDRADAADGAALEHDLVELLGDRPPPALQVAVRGSGCRTNAGLVAIVSLLHAERVALGADRFEALLGRVRTTLRARLDRELEYSA